MLARWLRKLDHQAQPSPSAVLKSNGASPAFDNIAHDIKAETMAIHLLIQPPAAPKYIRAALRSDARTIVLDDQFITLAYRSDTQQHLVVGPFAGVVQHIAQQLKHVFAIPRQSQLLRRLPLQLEVVAVNHAQCG